MDLESVPRKVLKWAMRERHTNIGPGECTKESVEMGKERDTPILDLESVPRKVLKWAKRERHTNIGPRECTKESVEMGNERETHQYWT